MALAAMQSVRKFRGSSQAQLMLASDGNLWVVKLQDNPQHLRVLANEFIVAKLAESVGLSVPATDIIEVAPELVETERISNSTVGTGKRDESLPGRHFGSRLASVIPGDAVDYLPDSLLAGVINLQEFAGILALDKWACNCDKRQAVFTRNSRNKRYSASFIDQGSCFNVGEWEFPDAPTRGTYPRNIVYSKISGWESFSPWLERIEEMSSDTILRIARSVPPEWHGGGSTSVERLAACLVSRQKRIRSLIVEFKLSNCQPFPNWNPQQHLSPGFLDMTSARSFA